MTETAAAKPHKKTGRRPFDPEDRRPRIGTRVDPETKKYLEQLATSLPEDMRYIGRAIDTIVGFLRSNGIDPTK